MRIHSDSIDELEVRKAARLAGISFTRLDLSGSRTRETAFDVILTGSSPRRQNGGEDMAATWDEWGMFLGTLFALDPAMVAGPKHGGYECAEHFHWVTGGRFHNFNLADNHVKGHNWHHSGESVTGSYHVAECGGKNGCGAIMRRLHRQTWAEFVAANA